MSLCLLKPQLNKGITTIVLGFTLGFTFRLMLAFIVFYQALLYI